MEEKNKIFRESALERLSSPERLDQLMQVVNSMDWVVLGTLSTLIGGVLIWSVVGRVPITIDGRGVFTQPRRVAELEANTSGQISSLNIQPGQCVEKDEVLATIDPIELKQQLRLAQGKLLQLQTQAQTAQALMTQRMQVEKNGIDTTRISLVQRLNDTQSLTPVLRSQGVEALAEQRRSLEQRLRDAQALVPLMQERLESRRKLVVEGAIARESLLEANQQYIQARQTVADISAQLKQLDVESTQTQRQYLENLRSAGDLQAQLQDLNSHSSRLDQEFLEGQTQRERELQDVNREITRLDQQIAINSTIKSTQAGCILEVMAASGQVVQPGFQFANMQVGMQKAALSGVLYFPVKDGKQIQPGMTIAMTPDTLQRERFGGIVGKVKSVSELPVTRQGTTAVIGNSEVVESLMAAGPMIEVHTTLETDDNTKSGYRWSSSKGPDNPITSGTTATARITIESRAPITFVMPFLQDLIGLK